MVSLIKDDLRQPGELVGRRDVTERAVESNVVVVIDVLVDSAPGFVDGSRAGRPDAFAFERTMPAFEFSIGLRIVRAGPDMCCADQSNELLEVSGEELWSVVADDAGMLSRKLLQSLLQDEFDLELLHGFAEIPVDDESAHAIEDGDQEVERSLDIDVGDIDVPVLVSLERLHESGSLLGGGVAFVVEPPRRLENAIDRGGADGDNIVIKHHERESAISFERMFVVVVQDGLSFPVFEPEVPRDHGIVLVDLPIAVLPLVELAGAQIQPVEQLFGRQFGTLGPVADVIDDLVSRVVGNPASFQSSPSSFFARTLASISSEMTSFFWTSLASRNSIRRWSLECS